MMAAVTVGVASILDSLKDRIQVLEERVGTLEDEADKSEQYTRCPNLRIQGIPETKDETTNELVITTLKKMGIAHIGADQLE